MRKKHITYKRCKKSRFLAILLERYFSHHGWVLGYVRRPPFKFQHKWKFRNPKVIGSCPRETTKWSKTVPGTKLQETKTIFDINKGNKHMETTKTWIGNFGDSRNHNKLENHKYVQNILTHRYTIPSEPSGLIYRPSGAMESDWKSCLWSLEP